MYACKGREQPVATSEPWHTLADDRMSLGTCENSGRPGEGLTLTLQSGPQKGGTEIFKQRGKLAGRSTHWYQISGRPLVRCVRSLHFVYPSVQPFHAHNLILREKSQM